jgi:hypothetical protein
MANTYRSVLRFKVNPYTSHTRERYHIHMRVHTFMCFILIKNQFMNTKYIIALLAGSLVLLASCSDNTADITVTPNDDTTVIESTDTIDTTENEEGVMIGGAMMVPSSDIIDNAVNSNDHTTLVAAVQAADLVEALKGEGPFTVFAPTNAAFDALPAGTVDTLLMPENKGDLTNVLTYHVVPGAYTSADLSDGLELTTLQ